MTADLFSVKILLGLNTEVWRFPNKNILNQEEIKDAIDGNYLEKSENLYKYYKGLVDNEDFSK